MASTYPQLHSPGHTPARTERLALKGPVMRELASNLWRGRALLGRVIDSSGQTIDGLGPPPGAPEPAPAGTRKRTKLLGTGVRAIDGLLACGQGQRVLIACDPGMDRSRLSARIARDCAADVCVIARIGQCTRDTRSFTETGLGPEALKRCVVVVAGTDESPAAGIRAAMTACAIAQEYRDQGAAVVLLVDCLDELAIAARKAPGGWAVMEALFRCAGNTAGGSITCFHTLLHDQDGPLDAALASLVPLAQGHIRLTAALAERGHDPPIDVLGSRAGAGDDLVDEQHRAAARVVREVIADYAAVEDLLNTGTYHFRPTQAGEMAIKTRQAVLRYLQQPPNTGGSSLAAALEGLVELRHEIESSRRDLDGPAIPQPWRPASTAA